MSISRIIWIVNPRNSFQHPIDSTIVRALQRGELAALEHIYRLFERAAYNLALRLTGRVDVAQDVLQDAMLKAFERAGQFRGEAPFGAWLRRLLINEALAHLRREHRLDWRPFEDVHADEAGIAPAALADSAMLEHALQKLPDTARAVLWLYHVEGFTHVEIAAQFGRSESFSKSQLARATHRLRELLNVPMDTPSCMPQSTTIA